MVLVFMIKGLFSGLLYNLLDFPVLDYITALRTLDYQFEGEDSDN